VSEQTQQEQTPEIQPTPAEQRARQLLDRICRDAQHEPEAYLRETEVPEGGE